MKKILFVCISLIACLSAGKADDLKSNALPLALQSFSVN
jgi:hypothetical protein